MSSLLHYTVHQYIKKFEKNDAGTEKVSLPVPEASDMSQAMGVSFDELHKELVRIQKDFEGRSNSHQNFSSLGPKASLAIIGLAASMLRQLFQTTAPMKQA